jgi:hypothetical protein
MDSKLIASSSEDGTVKLWETGEGKQAKTWNAHNGGVLCVAYSHDGRFVSCGRDGGVISWSADGAKLKAFEFFGEMALRCAWAAEDTRVIASDFAGRVAVWDAKSGQRLGELEANPRPLAEQVAALQAHIVELQARHQRPSSALTNAEFSVAGLKAELASVRATADQTQSDFAAKAAVVVRLKELAAGANPPSDIEAQLTAARRAREEARAKKTQTTNAVESLAQQLAAAQTKLDDLKKSSDPAAELAQAEAALRRLTLAQKRRSN